MVAMSLGASLLAQDPQGLPRATFKGGIDLVALSVTVTDQHQKHVPGLTPADFEVLEDGVPQDVSFFSGSETPLDLAILLDTSASMSGRLPLAQAAAIGLTRSLRQEDRAAVFSLKDSVDVLQSFTGDVRSLEAAIRSTRPGGGTALYNAVYIALKQFTGPQHAPQEVRRQAVVVLSDGSDTVSLITFDSVLDLAKRSGVAIYTVSLRPKIANPLNRNAGDASRSDYSMRALAQETGGRAFFPLEAGELPGIYASIGEELATQYALGYAPKRSDTDGSYRRVSVRVLNHPEARPRTRTGYFASLTSTTTFGR
jgi:VWFA-related protein